MGRREKVHACLFLCRLRCFHYGCWALVHPPTVQLVTAATRHLFILIRVRSSGGGDRQQFLRQSSAAAGRDNRLGRYRWFAGGTVIGVVQRQPDIRGLAVRRVSGILQEEVTEQLVSHGIPIPSATETLSITGCHTGITPFKIRNKGEEIPLTKNTRK